MKTVIELTRELIPSQISPPREICALAGAWVEFRGVVRDREGEAEIAALEYEAYEKMALAVMRGIVAELHAAGPILFFAAIHRIGVVPVGESAIYAGAAAKHRGPAFEALARFMDRLKQDVPIWKVRSLSRAEFDARDTQPRLPQVANL